MKKTTQHTSKPFPIVVALASALFVLMASPLSAFAACTSPSGNAGDITYSSTQNLMAYCNGTSWIPMGEPPSGGSTTTFGTLTTNDFCTATSGTAIACTTGSTGTGNVVLSAAPTLTGTVAGISSTWTTGVAIGTTALSGALNINGTATATTFNGAFTGNGGNLTNIGTTNMTAVIGTASATTYLRGDNTWAAIPIGSTTFSTLTTNDFCTATSSSSVACTTAATGTGNVVLATSPTLTTPNLGTPTSLTLTNATGLSLTTGVTGKLPIANGGTNTNSQTSNGVAFYDGASLTTGTGFIYNGTNVSIGTTSLTQALTVNGNIDAMGSYNGYLTEIPNSSTATVINKLAKMFGANTVTVGTSGDSDGMIGIVVGNAGTTGTAQIAIAGQAGCVFDNTPAAVGNFVTISSTTAGDCHDTGTKVRSGISSQTIGQVLNTVAISGTTYPVAISLNGSGGGIPAGTTGQVQYNSGSNSFAAGSNFTFLTATNELVVGTGAATPTATTGTVASSTVNYIPQAVSFGSLSGSAGGVTVNAGATGQMAYYTGASAISGTSNLIVSGSNIGIGSASPVALLDVGGTARFAGTSSAFGALISNAAEPVTVSATAATGTINFYLNSQSVLYYTSNASANWTVNFAFSSGTTMNSALGVGQAATAVFLVTQGTTAFANSAIQIDGTATGVTTFWQGGSAPSAGHASGIDVYQYTIIKTGSATYTVLASQTQY